MKLQYKSTPVDNFRKGLEQKKNHIGLGMMGCKGCISQSSSNFEDKEAEGCSSQSALINFPMTNNP